MVAGIRHLLDEGISIVGKVASFAPGRIEPILARNLQSLLRDRQMRYVCLVGSGPSPFLDSWCVICWTLCLDD